MICHAPNFCEPCVLCWAVGFRSIPVCDVPAVVPAWTAGQRLKYVAIGEQSLCTRKTLAVCRGALIHPICTSETLQVKKIE
jgi:hypothetical protein